MPKTLKRPKSQSERDRWIALVKQLVQQVKTWADDRDWSVHIVEKTIRESRLGAAYAVPSLRILSPSGEVQLDPVGRDIINADGRVDLFAWPSLTRMMLIRRDNKWVLLTDSGILWPEKWGEKTFAHLVKSLSAAA